MAQALTLEGVRQKLRIVKAKTAGQDAPATKAYSSTRITALDDGLNMNRPDGGTIRYADISLLVVVRLDSDPDTWYVDTFVYGQALPFRLSQKAINYRQFLPEISQRSKDNFFAFVLFLIEQADSVYVDEGTLEFLKTKKPVSYPDFGLFEAYTRQLWHQLLNWMKFRCDSCEEVYWVDESKVSPDGAKTKCVKCQHIITVTRREKPQPLQAASKQRKTVPCPHCQYENQEGAQFCVMCQEALVDFKARAKEKAASASKTVKEELPQAGGRSPKEEDVGVKEILEEVELEGTPLQARGKRSPTLSLGEIETALQNEIGSIQEPFGWYSKFALFMQILGFVFAAGGVLVAFYIYFAMEGPPPPDIITPAERLNYSIIAVISGILASLVSLVVSNIISLNLQIERNTKLTALLLQRLISKSE